MSRLFKFTLKLVVISLLVLCISIAFKFPNFVAVSIFALLPFAWSLWIVCVIRFNREEKVWPLFILWILIDLVALLHDRLALGSFHGFDPKGGSELALLFEFSPPILPMITVAMIPGAGEVIGNVLHAASGIILPAGSSGVIRDWIEGSILAATSSLVFVLFRLNWTSITKLLRFQA